MTNLRKVAAQGFWAASLALVMVAPALADVPNLNSGSGSASSTSAINVHDFFQNTVQTAINLIFFLAGAAAIIYLIWAGIKYITAGGDTKKAGEARQAIINAVIGIAVVVGAYTLINIAFGINNTVSSVSGGAQTFSN